MEFYFMRKILPFFLNVHAEEPDDGDSGNKGQTTPPTDPPVTNPTLSGTVAFEELIAKARQEEKDKLYPVIDSWKKKHNDSLLVIGERDKTIKELTTAKADLEKQISESNGKGAEKHEKEVSALKATITGLELKIADYEAKLTDSESKYALELYKLKKIAEAGNALIPELVTGSNEAEIDASIEASKTRYMEIISKSGGGGYTIPNPHIGVIGNVFKDKSPEEISKMSPKEWGEYRKSLGLK